MQKKRLEEALNAGRLISLGNRLFYLSKLNYKKKNKLFFILL